MNRKIGLFLLWQFVCTGWQKNRLHSFGLRIVTICLPKVPKLSAMQKWYFLKPTYVSKIKCKLQYISTFTMLSLECLQYYGIFTDRMRMPQSRKLPVSNLLTGQKSAVSPHRGDSLHQFTCLGACGSAWPCKLSRKSVHGLGTRPKSEKFPLFGKELPHKGNSLPNDLTKFLPNDFHLF